MNDKKNINEIRSPEIAYSFARRFSKNISKSDVSEALNSSTGTEAIGWNIDALNHMGFICQLGKIKIDKISFSRIFILFFFVKSRYSVI